MNILSLIYYAASAIKGAKKGIEKQLGIANVLACSYLFALIDDIVSGIFIIQTSTKAFSINDCLSEMAISFIFGLLYFKLDRYRKHLEVFSVVSDVAEISQFIIGASKVQKNNIATILCVIITTLFGEMATSAFFSESIKEKILSSSTYYITTVERAIVYVILTEWDIKDTDVKVILVFYTLLFVTLSNSNMRVTNKQYFIKLFKNIQQNELLYTHPSDKSIFLQMHICNEYFFCKPPTYNFTTPKQPYPPNIGVVFLLHRIRRM